MLPDAFDPPTVPRLPLPSGDLDLPTLGPPPVAPLDGPLESAAPETAPAAPRRRLPRPGRRARRAAAGILLLTLVSGGFGAGMGAQALLFAPRDQTPDAAHFALIREAWDILHQQYVGAAGLDGTKLADGAIDGLTQAVGDEGHTRFLTQDERQRENAELAGSFTGIGIQVDQRDGQLVIAGVFPKSPAQEAGLRSGDRIVAIDGQATAQRPLDDLLGSLRGAAGTSVRLSVAHAQAATASEVTVTRREVQVPAVEWAMVPGTRSADIHLLEFSTGSADELKLALKAARAAGATSLVLDLRGNPGGYVNEAITVTSQFLKDGIVFKDRDAAGNETPHPVEAGGLAPDLPLVVLVDHGSASSSEIVAGALQDAGRATLVGQTTFGTGTVLHEFGLSDGSALRVGTLQWLTRDGHQIWHQGITPDRIVALPAAAQPLTPDELPASGSSRIASADAQLSAALAILAARS
jgi:carboxyl-terminal processing protease